MYTKMQYYLVQLEYLSKVEMSSELSNITESSAYRRMFRLMTIVMSFIGLYTLNNKGPKMDPWGTPWDNGLISEQALFM